MPYIQKEDLARARQIDLLTYLRETAPNELVHVSRGTYCTRAHDSLKISSDGKWYWWSRRIGGRSALDYLIRGEGMSLPDAVAAVLGSSAIGLTAPPPPPPKKEEPAEFRLPPRHTDNRRVFAYLLSRGLHPEIINHCIKSGQLYEDAERHNCVFVGYEGDRPRYAALRGTLTHSVFVGEAGGSNKRFSFALPRTGGAGDRVLVFESAIDALSALTLGKQNGQDWKQLRVLSLGGVQRVTEGTLPPGLEQYLQDHPQVTRVTLCLDADGPGREASAAIAAELERRGYETRDAPPKVGKDYNDQLQHRMGIAGRTRTRGQNEYQR